MDSGKKGLRAVLVAIVVLITGVIETAEANCGGDLIMEEGTLRSPYYPDKFWQEVECTWRITVPENHQVALKFNSFDFRINDDCYIYNVAIRDGHESASPVLGRFCGSVSPKDILLSSGNKMTVTFVFDEGTVKVGFVAHFRKVAKGEPLLYAEDKESLENLTQFFLNIRQPGHLINKWGHDLPRVAMALYLSKQEYFHPSNLIGQEIAYEISLQLLSKLSLKKSMDMHELSFYVNSLLVSCIDPKDFFGINVVSELRRLADSSNYTNPFTILTLCNAGDDVTMNDVSKVLAAFHTPHRRLWTDNQALATMALACLSTRPNITVDEDNLNRMLADLKGKQHKNGTVDNLTSTALVVQALLATDSHLDDFDIKGAMKFISGNVRSESLSIIDSFYILPVLNGKSLLNISTDHCTTLFRTDPNVLIDLHNNKSRIQVQYSVFVGNEMDFIRTWKIKVPANYTFYDVLEKIASLEPEYRVRYSVIDGKPYVSGLTKMVDLAEREMYWFIYKQALGSSVEPQMIESSPVDIDINDKEEFILWYRSGTWISK